MKKYLNYRFVFVFCMVLSLILAHPLAVLADVKDLMISTDSNALMTLELDDADYLMMSPRSSIGTVQNTVKADTLQVALYYYDSDGRQDVAVTQAVKRDNRYSFNLSLPDGAVGNILEFQLFSKNLPSSGNYSFSFDFGSHFVMNYDPEPVLWASQKFNNTETFSNFYYPDVNTNSGDIYIPEYIIELGNLHNLYVYCPLKLSDEIHNVAGSFAFRFVKTNDSGVTLGYSTSSGEYESGVSSSLSDLSSSVGEMTEEISGITSAIQNLHGAMEPHYSNVLTQLHHITEQLHAFWDQQFNLHHVPLMAKLSDIIEAIGNMDLEVEVNLNSLKTSIDTMSQAVQNKLQSTTDHITGGYDNSGMESDQQKLDDALNQYESAENEVLGGAKEHISDFEFDDSLEQFSSPLSDISYFLGAMFTGLGVMNVIISFSLTLTIAMCMIGWYRFKGGK